MAQPADLLVTNVTLASPSTGWLPEPGWLAVRNGRVAAVGRAGDQEPAALRVIDGLSGLLLPGLRNAHTHGSEILARGCADGLSLGDWLATVWPKLDSLKPAEAALAALFGALQSIRCGVTAVVDHMRRTPMTDEVAEAVAAAYLRSGIRSLLAVMVRDRVDAGKRQVGARHLGMPETPSRQLERIETLAGRLSGGRISFGVGPSASIRCTDEMLQGVAELGTRAALPVHIHVAETQGEVASDRQAFGMTAIARLEKFGLMRPSTACAHCVWLDEEDLDIFADSGASIVHNPVSNLRLGSGVANMQAFNARGIPIAIGTDGAASNDGVDVWDALKFAALLPRRDGLVEARVNHPQMLDQVTLTGREALGPSSDLLPLAIGAPADFCLYPEAEMPFARGEAFTAALVLNGSRRPSHVVIGGDVVLDNGVFPDIDEAEVTVGIRQLTKEVIS